MAISLQQFVTQVDESGILSAEEIAAFQETQTTATESAEDFAKLLVRQKKLTKLQAQMIYSGKGKQLLLGNYLILDKIGAGGMGDVYLAEHRRMERKVALKTLPAAMTKDAQSIQRFHREVKAAAKLNHPNIVTAYDADEAKGIHYFVMEHVEGIDLSVLVKKQGAFSVEQAINYIMQAATGLEYAHEERIVHRDIKPSNMLLDKKGTIKILDMGLARIDNVDDENPVTDLTQSGSVMGTVDYMSPEQAQNTHTADARSDIYSLGCSFYYLLTADSVYGGQTVVNRIMAHRDQPIPSLLDSHTYVPADVDAVYQKMIAKQPEDRYQSMQEVIAAFQDCELLKPSSSGSFSSTEPSNPELHNFLQTQQVESTPTIIVTEEKPLVETQKETFVSGMLDNTQVRSSVNRYKKTLKSIDKKVWIATSVVLLGLLLLAGIFLRVETSAGTIILEIDQPELAGAVVSVDDQKKITIKTGEGKEPIEVVADEKTHTLKVTKGGFETFTKQFTVKAGKQQAIKVRLEPLVVVKRTLAQDNYALEFDGKTSYVKLSGIKYEAGQPFTFEGIVVPEAVSQKGPKKCFFQVHGMGKVEIDTFSSGHLAFMTSHEQADKPFQAACYSSGAAVPRTPIHVACVYDGKSLQLFVNGVNQNSLVKIRDNAGKSTSQDYKGEVNTVSGVTEGGHLGCVDINAKDPLFFDGIIDEVRISNIARYTKDFTPAKRFETDKHTLALYHFDEAKGDVLQDSSGNNHHGKIVGAKWVKVDDELKVIKSPEPITTSNNPDRRAAERVLSIGGQVAVIANAKRITVNRLEELPKEPFFVTSIDLSGNEKVTDHGLRLLKDLKELRELHLRITPITNAGMQHLANLTNLTKLDIYGTSVGDDGLQYLAKLEKLYNLQIQSTKITDVGFKHLANLRNLVALSVYGTKSGDKGLEQIKNLSKITSISVGHLTTDDGLKHLAHMNKLTSVVFDGSKVTGSGLVHLHNLEKLVSLDLRGSPVTDSGLQNVSKLTNLQILRLRSTRISDAGLKHLAGCKQLEALSLENTKITGTGLKHLKPLKKLHRLNLDGTKISDDTISNLDELPLKSLGMSETLVTDGALKHLESFKQLEVLGLIGTQVTTTGINALTKKLPQCRISYGTIEKPIVIEPAPR